MRIPYIAMTAAMVIACPAIAQERTAEALIPSSAWNLDMAEDSCALSRNFGDDASSVMLQMRQYAPGAPFVTTVVSQRNLQASINPVVYLFRPTRSRRPNQYCNSNLTAA